MTKVRDKRHRKFISSLCCAKCYRPPPSQAAHIDERMNKSIASKTSDKNCIPLCADSPNGLGCHSKRDQHHPDDAPFWEEYNEKAIELGKRLYEVSGDKMKALEALARWKKKK